MAITEAKLKYLWNPWGISDPMSYRKFLFIKVEKLQSESFETQEWDQNSAHLLIETNDCQRNSFSQIIQECDQDLFIVCFLADTLAIILWGLGQKVASRLAW